MPPVSADSLPMSEVLDMALGSPDDGCVNLVLLHAVIKRLVVFVGAENIHVNIKGEAVLCLAGSRLDNYFDGLKDNGLMEEKHCVVMRK